MIPEVAEYQAAIADRLSLIADMLEGLSEEQLNRRPPFEKGNSAWVLAHHALGAARAWVLGIACGLDVGRDRPAEFASSGSDVRDFREDVARSVAEMQVALDVLTLEDLGRRFVPAKDLWGEAEPYEISVRHALMRAVEHASLHLGHLQLTRDLILYA
jgi:hypothetical protein